MKRISQRSATEPSDTHISHLRHCNPHLHSPNNNNSISFPSPYVSLIRKLREKNLPTSQRCCSGRHFVQRLLMTLTAASMFLHGTPAFSIAPHLLIRNKHIVCINERLPFPRQKYQPQSYCLYLIPPVFSESSIGVSSTAAIQMSSDSSDMNESFSNDEDDWGAILAAFRMYKAAYGDLRVPSRFIVPSLPPWPENAWGVKLGHRVAAIRATGRYVKDHPDRLRTLEKLGFQWQIRAGGGDGSGDGLGGSSLEQIFAALDMYRQLWLQQQHQKQQQPNDGDTPLSVPPNFVVPNNPPWPENTRGLPLGKLLQVVRSKEFLMANPQAEQRLDGLFIDGKKALNDARFQKVYEALQRYKELNGDLFVPQPFVVPKLPNVWAEDLWGLRLGARVNAIRSQGTFVTNNPERRKLLDDLGFSWRPPLNGDRGKKRGRPSKADMEKEFSTDDDYENETPDDDNADLFAPGRSEDVNDQDVDEDKFGTDDSYNYDDNEPSSSLGSLFGQSFDLGGGNARWNDGSLQTPPTWGLQQSSPGQSDITASDEKTNQAIAEYQKPTNLTETLLEAAARAIEVGVIVPVSEGKRVTKGKREKEIPWYNDDFGEEFVFEDVVEALTIYKTMYGDWSNLTNGEFVVPFDDGGYGGEFDEFEARETFDVEASSRAAAAIAAYRQRNLLAESDELVASEIRRLQDDVTPSNREKNLAVKMQSTGTGKWPEHLAGMMLGNIYNRIRDGSLEVKHLPERKSQLDEIGFDWGDPKYFVDIPFEKAMCGMYAYYLVRGDMFVYEDFAIPDEDPWPKALAGYEVGKAVKRIRELQYFLEAYHPDKVSLLRMFDFMWFPTAALPLDPNEPEMTPELLLLSAMGHPDYAKMDEIPMGLPDKIISEGPFYDSDDPKHWWRKWHNWDCVKDYWYQKGRRDNAFVLRRRGYPQMADEHEAKYGPGLFKQLEAVMKQLEDGIESSSQEEKESILKKLNEIRLELVGCTDISPLDQSVLLDDLDAQIHALVTEGRCDLNKISRFEAEIEFDYVESNSEAYDDEEEKAVIGKSDREDREEDEDDDGDGDFDNSDDIDVEEELGLYQS